LSEAAFIVLEWEEGFYLSVEIRRLQRENLTSRAYEGIKEALMKGRFRPGEKLGIRELARQMGTSPTPVREALLQLVSSHALEMKPAHSVTVPVLTKERYMEVRTLRIALEGLAAEQAAQKIGRGKIKDLQRIHDSLAEAKASGKYKETLAKNQAFHFELCKAADMPLLLALIELLWLQIGPSLNLIYPPASPDPVKKHYHIQILEALGVGDGGRARKAMENDLIHGGAQLLTYLQDREREKTGRGGRE
jgi:GntR family colanic acid and biofilm gene transcriptional regulator